MTEKVWHICPNEVTKHDFHSEWRTVENGGFSPEGEMMHWVTQRLICLCKCSPLIYMNESSPHLIIHSSLDTVNNDEWTAKQEDI